MSSIMAENSEGLQASFSKGASELDAIWNSMSSAGCWSLRPWIVVNKTGL